MELRPKVIQYAAETRRYNAFMKGIRGVSFSKKDRLVVVFIHEYGHYYFARKYGVGVTDFSIGFGKELFGWNDKSGTRWKICAIPLGGYVKFFDKF